MPERVERLVASCLQPQRRTKGLIKWLVEVVPLFLEELALAAFDPLKEGRQGEPIGPIDQRNEPHGERSLQGLPAFLVFVDVDDGYAIHRPDI
ncbi:hypothetical protein D9M68_879190 [compost metagenome]